MKIIVSCSCSGFTSKFVNRTKLKLSLAQQNKSCTRKGKNKYCIEQTDSKQIQVTDESVKHFNIMQNTAQQELFFGVL